MNNATDNRIKVLEGYYADLDAMISAQARIVDTYEGMLSMCPNGEGSENILRYLDGAQADLALLQADRCEIDRMWNESVEWVPA